MLRTREDFAHVSAQGRTRADRLLVMRYVPNGQVHDRFGISISRRLGGAVARNRLRRRLREILRRDDHDSRRGWDILIVARPGAISASFDELRMAAERLLLAVHGSSEAAP
jgi:ribonuclease P protein component